MAQRHSGRDRIAYDQYETIEPWITEALLPHLPAPSEGISIWEPACGSGHMVRVLEAAGYNVHATDIQTGHDFLASNDRRFKVIVTNPPFKGKLPQLFVEHALDLVGSSGIVCMLLRNNWDSAKGRRHLFGDCPAWCRKIVLARRPRWIKDSTGSPSENFDWYIWHTANTAPMRTHYWYDSENSRSNIREADSAH